MKTTITLLVLAFGLSSYTINASLNLPFTEALEVTDKFEASDSNARATANKQEGVYLFMHSKPAAAYDYLGTVKVAVVWKNDPASMLRVIIRKVKKKYPGAEGIIFNADMDNVDVIRFNH
jgi:hypothetical protein